MKIGILTYHRTLNYGACLQAIATRVALERMGHEAYYVDYWPEYHKDIYRIFSIGTLRRRIRHPKSLKTYLLDILRYHADMQKRIDNFDEFYKHYVYPYCVPTDTKFDAVIYGSDQIWRKQGALKDYNPVYFGDNDLKTSLHIAYAASMGVMPKNDKDKNKIKDLVSHINHIGVREQDLADLLVSLGYSDIHLNIDPTLLLSAQEWDEKIPTEPYFGEKYVLVYQLKEKPFNLQHISEFAKNHNLGIKVLNGYATSRETTTNITTPCPSEFIRLIRNAEYVFSGSFHGTVFSIIYHKQVFASNKKNNGRMKTLFSTLGIEGRLIEPMTPIPDDIKTIDYEQVDTRLNTLKEGSIEYLKKSLLV